VDLSDLTAEELAGEHLDVQVGVGEIVVLLPPASVVPVELTGRARAGQVDLLGQGREDGGTNIVEHRADRLRPAEGDGASPPERLSLDLEVGLGDVQVVRQPGR
jgi:hypothetical protein